MTWRLVRRATRAWRQWRRAASGLSPYLLRQSNRLVLALVCGVGYMALRLAEPWILALIIDNVLLDRPRAPWLEGVLSTATVDRLGLLHWLVVALVVLALMRGVFYYYQRLLTARAGQQATADIRLDLYSHLQHLPFSFHDRRRTGDVLTRLTSDTRLLRDIFISLPLALTSELLLMIGMVTIMALMDVTLTLLALTAIPAVAVVLRLFQRRMKQAVRRQRQREGHMSTIAAEALGAIRVVQGFRRERHEIKRFGSENRRGLRDGLRGARLEARLRWSVDVIVAIVVAAVLSVATRRVLAGQLSPGDLVVFVTYLRTFVRPITQVSKIAERSARGAAAGERVLALLKTEQTVADRPDAVAATGIRGQIEFDDVDFSHRRGAAVLAGIRLNVQPGERIVIVGPTGCGKSTLLSLIPRFYDVTGGSVRIDGGDVRQMTLSSLRKRVSVVFQESVLFAATIAENIGYGKPNATRDEIVEAARSAGIHHIVEDLPDGYETMLGERGATLSGGQRQCIAIARAMIKDAPIVLLDEPLTGLDARSAEVVSRALDRLMKRRTVLLVSHDLVRLPEVDRICVLEAGRLVDEGPLLAIAGRHTLIGSRESRSSSGAAS
jgi:ATP-binding cassette subfamily B protein